jgi:hypothetical protein
MIRRLWLATAALLALSACRGSGAQWAAAPWPEGRQWAPARGGAVVLAAPQADLAVILDQGPGFEVRDVLVSAVELPTGYLVETVDPEGRFLPAVAVAIGVEGPVVPVEVEQVKAEAQFAIRRLGYFAPQALAREHLGTMPLEKAMALLRGLAPREGINILIPQGLSLRGDALVDLYSTDGGHTVLMVPAAAQSTSTGHMMAQAAPQAIPWLSFSASRRWLESHSLLDALN